MKRETRANWWFIIIFLIVSLPGAVILFFKKLDPSAARFDQPEEMLTSLPYMAPLPAPPDMKWIVPQRTFEWLREVTREHSGFGRILSAVSPGPEWEPVISSDHLIQVMTWRPGENSEWFGLVIWKDGAPTEADAYKASIDGWSADPAKISLVPVPEHVRKELVALGYVRPPKQVIWMDIALGPVAVSGPYHVALEWRGADGPLRTSVNFELGNASGDIPSK